MHELGLALTDAVRQGNNGQKRFSLGCGILGLAAQPESLHFGERVPKPRCSRQQRTWYWIACIDFSVATAHLVPTFPAVRKRGYWCSFEFFRPGPLIPNLSAAMRYLSMIRREHVPKDTNQLAASAFSVT